MNLKSFSKLAAVSVIALGTAMYSTGVIAAAVQIGTAVSVPFGATVENTIQVTVTPATFGTIGSFNDTTDTASMTLDATTDLVTEDAGNGSGGSDPASIVADGVSVPAAAIVAVTGAFTNTNLYVTYDTCDDLTGPGAMEFVISDITDNLNTPGGTDCSATLPLVAGIETTDGAGALTFEIGATITTDLSAIGPYPDGAYTGSVNMYITY